MAMWHTSAGRLHLVGSRSSLRQRWTTRRKHERGPTVLAWQDLHDPDADGYHESLGALRPRSRRD
jgi:hypothetical protein